MNYITKSILLFLFFTIPFAAFAQTKEELAQGMYQRAESAYENRQYADCTKYLAQAIDLLTKANPKILYLMAKSQYESIKEGFYPATTENYKTVDVKINDFFKTVDKSTYPAEKYTEMVSLKILVEEKIAIGEKDKAKYINLKKREASFIKDTIDVYAAAFCKDFNDAFAKQPVKPLENREYGMNLDCPVKLEYDPFQHAITVYDSKNLKYWHKVNVLTKISISLGAIYFYTDSELEKNFTSVNAKTADNYTGDPDANKWRWQHAINFMHKAKEVKNWTYDFSTAAAKMEELIAIMDRTGFTDYYNNKLINPEN